MHALAADLAPFYVNVPPLLSSDSGTLRMLLIFQIACSSPRKFLIMMALPDVRYKLQLRQVLA